MVNEQRPSREFAELLMSILGMHGYGIMSAREENELESRMVIWNKAVNAYLRITIQHDTDSN